LSEYKATLEGRSVTRLKYVKVRIASATGIAERWRQQYHHPKDSWILTAFGNPKIIYEKLCALGPAPEVEAAANAIGNKSWSYLSCDGCNDYVLRAVEIGEYEPKIYCKTCIDEASAAFQEISK
jgi:hypothetical protein